MISLTAIYNGYTEPHMPIEESPEGYLKEYMRPVSQRVASILGPHVARNGVSFTVYDAEEDLVATVYATRASEESVERARERARKIAEMLDGEEGE